MTDPKVLIFGSFTEDEIKSLQCQVVQNHVEITFGSLDSATLRSVGICNAKQAEFGYFKGSQPSKNIEKKNAKTISTAESRSHVIVTTTDNTQSIHGLHTGCNSHDIQELKTSNEPSASYVTENICNSRNCLSAGLHCLEDLSISSEPSVKEALTSSSKGVGISNSMGSFYKASNGPVATARNLLPRGLVNLGNLCFLNSTLQALLSCSSFVQLLLDLRTRDIQKIEYPTLHAFVEFISDFDVPVDSSLKRKDTVLETGRPFRPLMFESILKIFTPDVLNSLSGRPRQEDAQEFLSFLMHQMHDELLKFEGRIPNGNEGRVGLILAMNDEDDKDNWETVGPRNKTAITRAHSFISSKLSAIFGGQLKSVVKARGNKASATIQPFLLLHLNVCPEPVCTIEDALRLFSAPETLEGYRASAAGKAEVVSASKSIKILELPEIMILHLMRFSYGSQGSTKLNKPVRFPLDLVLGRQLLVSPSSEGRRYELVATITHHGREPSKGHYTADARRENGKWMHYDDASVTAISPSKVLHDQAYVLFYKQV